MSCEDFPCCGHEYGCCPDYRNGRQINMRCTCGAKVPLNSRSSLCESCLNAPEGDEEYYDDEEEEEAFDHDTCHDCGEDIDDCQCEMDPKPGTEE